MRPIGSCLHYITQEITPVICTLMHHRDIASKVISKKSSKIFIGNGEKGFWLLQRFGKSAEN